MKINLKIEVVAPGLVAAFLMQTAQAEDLFTVYLHAKERDYKVQIAEEDYIAKVEQSDQAMADFKPKVTLRSSSQHVMFIVPSVTSSQQSTIFY